MSLLSQLTKLVALSAPASTSDGRGGQVAAPDVPLHPSRAWMSLVPQQASEALSAAGQRKPVRRYAGRMRFHPQVKEGTRVTWRQRTFEVVGVMNVDEAGRELALELVERTQVTGGLA